MPTCYLFMLCGLPCTGKSTFAKTIMETNHRISSNQIFHLSSDEFIEKLARADGKTYDETFQKYIKVANRSVLQDASAFATSLTDMVWDQTNLTPKTRKWKLGIGSRNDFIYRRVSIAIYFEESLEVLLERNKNRPGKTIPEDVMIRMAAVQYARPTWREGFHKVMTPDQFLDWHSTLEESLK
jgi:predicted kinase